MWSEGVDGGVGLAAAEQAVAGPAIEEGDGATGGGELGAAGLGGGEVGEVAAVVGEGQDDAVVVVGGRGRDFALGHVEGDELGLTFEGIAPAAAAGGVDPDEGAGRDRVV